MNEPIDLVSDAELSALVDGELAPDAERALRERIEREPALADRLARFEALNRALRTEPESGTVERLSAGLASRIAADADSEGSAVDDAPPVFGDESSDPSREASNGGEVVPLRSGRMRRAAPWVVAAAAAALVVAVVTPTSEGPVEREGLPNGEAWIAEPSGGSEGAVASPAGPADAALPKAPLETSERRGEAQLADAAPAAETADEVSPAPSLQPAGPDRSAAPSPSEWAANDSAKRPSELAAGRSGSEAPSTRPLAADDALVAEAPDAEGELLPKTEEPLELYALALDQEVVGPDFEVIDNLELLELLAALEEEAARG